MHTSPRILALGVADGQPVNGAESRLDGGVQRRDSHGFIPPDRTAIRCLRAASLRNF
jgi:hypothetical protein